MKEGVEPGEGRDLSALKAVGSTGSPLAPEGFQWVYDHVGADTWLFSTSGGTDVVSAFVGGVPTLPVYRGELQGRALGAKVESWDPDGKPLIGEVGELVHHRADAVDADLLLGRRGRLAAARVLLRALPRRLAPRRLDRDHRARHGDHLRPQRLDHQPRRDPDGHQRDLPRACWPTTRSSTRWWSTSRAKATEGWMPLFVVLREGEELDDELVAAIKRAHPHGLLAAPRAQRGPPDRRGPAHAERQGAGGAGQADPHGPARRPGRLARLAGQPGGAGRLRRDGVAERTSRLVTDRREV